MESNPTGEWKTGYFFYRLKHGFKAKTIRFRDVEGTYPTSAEWKPSQMENGIIHRSISCSIEIDTKNLDGSEQMFLKFYQLIMGKKKISLDGWALSHQKYIFPTVVTDSGSNRYDCCIILAMNENNQSIDVPPNFYGSPFYGGESMKQFDRLCEEIQYVKLPLPTKGATTSDEFKVYKWGKWNSSLVHISGKHVY